MDQLTPGQDNIYRVVVALHPGAVVIRRGDEWTGVRFGQAKCRYGRSRKLGYTTYSHQVWVSWADHDIRKHGE